MADDNLLPAKLGAMASGGAIRAIIPTDMESAFRLAKLVHSARLAPHDMDTPEKITIAILTGMELELPPMMALQSLAIINGRPCIWGDGALAKVISSGLMETHDEGVRGEGEEQCGYCTMKRRGVDRAVTHIFSVADARRAGLWQNPKKDPWVKYPQRMLVMRPRSWVMRDLFADVLKGVRIVEEMRDVEPRDITPSSTNMLEERPPEENPADAVAKEHEAEVLAMMQDKPPTIRGIATENLYTGQLVDLDPATGQLKRADPAAADDDSPDAISFVDAMERNIKNCFDISQLHALEDDLARDLGACSIEEREKITAMYAAREEELKL